MPYKSITALKHTCYIIQLCSPGWLKGLTRGPKALSMYQPLPDKLREIALQKPVIIAIVLVNVLGAAFGFYYYTPQFGETVPLLWIFVADSPLATLSIALSLMLHLRGKPSGLIDAFAFISNLKYGLWTVFVLAFYFDSFWAINSAPIYLFLFSSHLLMAIQSFLVLEYTDFSFEWLTVSAVWFLLNDSLDYFIDIHPWLFSRHGHPLSAAMIAAYSLSAAGLLIYSSGLDSPREPLLQTRLSRRRS